jgi:hypothetical protein
MFDKRYQEHRTFFTVKHFPNSVDAAMPNKLSSNICKVIIRINNNPINLTYINII